MIAGPIVCQLYPRWNGETNNETNILKSIFFNLDIFFAAIVTENFIQIYIDPGRWDLLADPLNISASRMDLLSRSACRIHTATDEMAE